MLLEATLGAAALYACLSALLFAFPHWLHARKAHRASRELLRGGGPMRVCAHRGGALENYENSRSAFAHCLALGLNYAELDVWPTRDRQWLIAHDESLARLTGQREKIGELNEADVGAFLEQTDYAYGGPFRPAAPAAPAAREGCIALPELLRLVGDRAVFLSVDVKTNQLRDVLEVARLVEEAGFADRTLIGSIFGVSVRDIKDAQPTVGAYFPAREVWRLLALFATGLLPFCALRADVLQMPFAFETLAADFRSRGHGWMFQTFRLGAPLFRLLNWHLHRRGIPVAYFIANSAKDFELCRWLGADAVMTDRPEFALEYLRARG